MREGPKWTDIAIVVLTVGIVFFACMQWVEMRGAGQQTDKLIKYSEAQVDAAKRIAAASGVNAEAAKKFSASAEEIKNNVNNAVKELHRAANDSEKAIQNSAQSAQDALNVSIQAVKLDQRPWIGVHGQAVQFTRAGPFRVTILLQNTGKTPGFHARLGKTMQVVAGHFDGAPFEGDDVMQWADIGPIPPQVGLPLSGDDIPNGNITANYDAVQAGQKFLYVWGRLIYWETGNIADSSGHLFPAHYTKFCFEYDRISDILTLCSGQNANDMN
jgi:hypothetical protein